MASKSKQQTQTPSNVLDSAAKVLQESLGYEVTERIELEGESCLLAKQSGSPAVLVYTPEHLSVIRPEDEELVIQLGAVVNDGPAAYVWATSTGVQDEGFIYSWLPDHECQVSKIPSADELAGLDITREGRGAIAADPARFKELQHEFDDLHEKIYAAREPIDGSNDLTAQLCKLIFLKMHIERYPDFKAKPEAKPFIDIFKPEYIKANKTAVQEIMDAFEVAKDLEEYRAKDDQGRDFRIFDKNDYIKFSQPSTYALIAGMLNKHQLTSPERTGVEDDILGRAFDVMLRGRFEGKGGMGVYLTPQQVRDAMVSMAFTDILKEDPGLLTRRNAKTGKPEFRVCDPCCGSAGFLVTAMRELRKHVHNLLGLSLAQQQELLGEIYSEGFAGSDNAPGMVLLARINMALHGDPKARVYRVDNSLSTDAFLPETYDLILTNPPFKKGGVKTSDQPELMEMYQSDIVDGAPQMEGDKLALGAKPNNKGVWKPVNSIDPAVLFIDRCLQLLKPGGRLIAVLPDGILCNSGDRYVREYLMGAKDEETGQFVGGKAIVKAVVSLPPITFKLSGAGAKTSFLYLQKKRPGDEQGPVFMAVADEVGFDVKQNKEVLTGKNDLVSILEAYRAGLSEEEA